MSTIHKPVALRLRQYGAFILALAMMVFGVDAIGVLFFGGIRLKVGDFVLRSTTIEFPVIALLISLFSFLLLKGKWKESILLFGSLSLSCLIGEAMLRFVDHPWSKPFIDAKEWQEPSDVLGYTMASNFEGRGPLDVWVKTNSQGFRDDGEHPWTKSPGVIRILGLGDSFTFGWGVTLEESFLKKLERILETRTGMNIETINAGIPGWDLDNYYVYYKEIGVRYSPDIIVLSYYLNDLNSKIRERIPAELTKQKGWKHRGGIFHISYLFNFVKSLAHNIRLKNRYKRFDYMYELSARRKEKTRFKKTLIFDPGKKQTQASSHIIKTLLKKIQGLANKHGSRLVIMYIPDVVQPHHPELQFINGVLASITEEMNIPFIDMTRVFESSTDPKSFYFWPKDVHTNADGHEKMAEALTPLICQVLLEKNIHCTPTIMPTNDPKTP